MNTAPNPHEDRPPRPAGLLEKLMSAIRPEFRQDDLAFDPRHLVFGGPACAVEGCDRPARSNRMCWGHSVRWTREGRPDLETFLVTTPARWVGHRLLDACAVDGCRYGLHSHGMCQRHWRQWKRCGSQPMTGWQTSTVPLPVPSPLPEVCRISYCDLWVRGTSAFCTGHDGRWKALGRPGTEDFTVSYEESGPGGSEHIDLRRLPMQLRLEVQYALQCRHDEATKKIRPAWAQRLADAQIRSLLDEPEEFWKTFRGPTGNWATGWGTTACLQCRNRISRYETELSWIS